MSVALTTRAEEHAKKAEHLPAFGGLNLLYIKRQVASLLGMIGRDGIFDQYTKHDISHIDTMLRSLDWIIPSTTAERMSTADWLMVVLAVYFHDLGMLVTKDEFAARASSGFPEFCEQVLFAGPVGPDYRAKVNASSDGDTERFLYQEFVRYKHAERVRGWITGLTRDQLGISPAVMSEVSSLLHPLGQQFRRDLGIVCESHHLNDLGDTTKYKLSQPYGNSDAETTNLQYCAVLLRTADLLHITSDRTPSIEFRTINPSDPLSQQEWAKQLAVTRVRPKLGVDEDGQADEAAPQDTIEVYAYFSREDGFFGLTSYLTYAADQLRKSNEWISNSLKLRLAKHEFPWRKIDDSNVETEGFIRDAFEFRIDQAKILDLLTGHTLYNDTNVVLRELVQNSIDAIRLQTFPNSPASTGHVSIVWDSKERLLSVKDNGTGMTQDIINKFLLNVGSSRYQDPEFVKQYPKFSSISRFGIGVLSTFMIADSVEIVTCHPDEEHARRLTLRSVHGKYLIRLLDKSHEEAATIGPHGTMFKLRIRPTIKVADVQSTAKHWIVVPECKVTVQSDGADPVIVGFSCPADALRDFLKSSDLDYEEGNESGGDDLKRRIRIMERQCDGVSVAYAVTWNPWFKEWAFLTTSSFRVGGNNRFYESERPPLGTCVEGIRIVNDTPGFNGYPIVALANVRGQSAPKTNVARSGLEATGEREELLKIIYRMYAEHVATELKELCEQRAFSPSWAARETGFLLGPLLFDHSGETDALNPQALDDAISMIPCVMVEEAGKRVVKTPKELVAAKELWTIDCGLLTSAEALLREVASAASLSELTKALKGAEFRFPSAPVVCGDNPRSQILRGVFARKEVDRIIVNAEERRVDLRWVDRVSPPRWTELSEDDERLALHFVERETEMRRGRQLTLPLVPREGVIAEVPSGEIAVRAFGSLFLVPGSPIAEFARQRMADVTERASGETLVVAVCVLAVISEYVSAGRAAADPDSLRKAIRFWDSLADHLQVGKRIEDLFDFAGFATLVAEANWKSFDTSAWNRDRMWW